MHFSTANANFLKMKNLSIIGAGAQGVAIAAQAARQGLNVRFLTRRANLVKRVRVADHVLSENFEAPLTDISDDPQKIIAPADVVLSTLPGFALEKTLYQIRPFLRENVPVGGVVGSNGFAFLANKILSPNPLFAFSRTPYIARLVGENHVAILGNKKELLFGSQNLKNAAFFSDFWTQIVATPAAQLPHFWDMALSNSNPLLHTARLFALFSKNQKYPAPPYFYKDWDDFSSQILWQMDLEFQSLLAQIPAISKGAVTPLAVHYEVQSPQELTAKIQSIAAFQNILTPAKNENGAFVADTAHRYFVEDFAFGLAQIVQLVAAHQAAAPTIFKVWEWAKNIPDIAAARSVFLEKSVADSPLS